MKTFTFAAILMATSITFGADTPEKASTEAVHAPSRNSRGTKAAPKTVAEALKALEQILGRHEPKDARQFRIPFDRDDVQRPERDKPTVLDSVNGVTIYGTPFRVGETACFDILQHHERTVYRVEDQGDREVVRRQQRFFLARLSFRQTDVGPWAFQATFLSHSIPQMIGHTYMTGTADWLENAIRLHATATDSLYTADGELLPAVFLATIDIVRRNGSLAIDDSWQAYHAVRAEDALVNVPDRDRPIGEPAPWLKGRSVD